MFAISLRHIITPNSHNSHISKYRFIQTNISERFVTYDYLSDGLNVTPGIYRQISGITILGREPTHPHENVPGQIHIVATSRQVPRNGNYLKISRLKSGRFI